MGTVLLVLVLSVALLAAGLVAVHLRRSPLQAVQDERTALFGAQEGKGQAKATEGDLLLGDLRKLLVAQLETIRDERATTTTLRGYVNKERDVSQALCDQGKEVRLVVEGLCAQLSAERCASEALRDQLDAQRATYEALCEELDVQRCALVEAFYHLNAPARVEAAAQAIEQSRALRKGLAGSKLVQGEPSAVRRGDEETKREGVLTRPATLEGQSAASAEQGHAGEKQSATRAGGEPPVGERPTALPTTPDEFAEQSRLVAATATSDLDADADADGTATTQAVSMADMEAALRAAAKGKETEDGEETSAWSSAAMIAAIEVEAGGATLSPQGVPRAVHSGAVAPPASGSCPLPLTAPMKAPGLGNKTKSAHVAPPPARRTETLAGMPAVHLHEPAAGPRTQRLPGLVGKQEGGDSSSPTPAGAASRAAAPFVTKTLLSAGAPSGPPPSSPSSPEASSEPEVFRDTVESLPVVLREHSNNGDASSNRRALEPPRYAPRRPTLRSAEEPHGFDGVPEGAPGPRLAPTDETPRRPRGDTHEATK